MSVSAVMPGRSASAPSRSWACPGSDGSPWDFVVNPLLSARYIPPSGPPFCPSTGLVGADDRGIDPGICVVGIVGQTLEHPLPDAALAPTRMASVDDSEISEPVRQISPRNPHAIPIQHRFDKQPMILRCHAYGFFMP